MEEPDAINAVTSVGWSPLHLAAATGHERATRVLLACGCSPHLRNESVSGYTPLHLAARQGNSTSLEALLEHGGDACCLDALGFTPLHLAAQCGDSSGVSIL